MSAAEYTWSGSTVAASAPLFFSISHPCTLSNTEVLVEWFKSTISAVQLPCSITSSSWSSKHIWKLNHPHTLAHNHTQQYVTWLWQVCAEIGQHHFCTHVYWIHATWNTGDNFSFPTLLPLASGLSHNTNGSAYMETKRGSKQKTKQKSSASKSSPQAVLCRWAHEDKRNRIK